VARCVETLIAATAERMLRDVTEDIAMRATAAKVAVLSVRVAVVDARSVSQCRLTGALDSRAARVCAGAELHVGSLVRNRYKERYTLARHCQQGN
jgi:hypothetical protein